MTAVATALTATPIPSFGATREAVWRGWRDAPTDLGRSSRIRQVYALDVGQSLEFFFSAAGGVSVVVDRGLCRDATPAELRGLDEAVAKGWLEVYRRGPWNGYCDERADRLVLHRATGRAVE